MISTNNFPDFSQKYKWNMNFWNWRDSGDHDAFGFALWRVQWGGPKALHALEGLKRNCSHNLSQRSPFVDKSGCHSGQNLCRPVQGGTRGGLLGRQHVDAGVWYFVMKCGGLRTGINWTLRIPPVVNKHQRWNERQAVATISECITT